jgi:hypothetical protein
VNVGKWVLTATLTATLATLTATLFTVDAIVVCVFVLLKIRLVDLVIIASCSETCHFSWWHYVVPLVEVSPYCN